MISSYFNKMDTRSIQFVISLQGPFCRFVHDQLLLLYLIESFIPPIPPPLTSSLGWYLEQQLWRRALLDPLGIPFAMRRIALMLKY